MSTDSAEWPKSVDAAVRVLMAIVPEAQLERIASMERSDLVVALHFGLGMAIRNEFGLWKGNRALLEATGAMHPDDASSVIIEALWNRLREAPPGLH